MKKFKKIMISLTLFIVIIFGLGYITRVIYDLKDTKINENIVVTIKGKNGLFLINPNSELIKNFSGNYSKIEFTNIDISTKIYNQNNKYYYKKSGVFSSDGKLLKSSWLYPNSKFQAFWTEDSKYLIRTDGYVVRMFGLFFSTPTIQQVIHIVEPSTKKSKQILLFDESGKLLEIEKIEGYIK